MAFARLVSISSNFLLVFTCRKRYGILVHPLRFIYCSTTPFSPVFHFSFHPFHFVSAFISFSLIHLFLILSQLIDQYVPSVYVHSSPPTIGLYATGLHQKSGCELVHFICRELVRHQTPCRVSENIYCYSSRVV